MIIVGALAAISLAYLIGRDEASIGTRTNNDTTPVIGKNSNIQDNGTKSNEQDFFTPSIRDDSLVIETVIEGLNLPTSLAFLDHDTILVLERNGTVLAISDGRLQEQPVLEVSVLTDGERGLLGVAIMNETVDAGNSNQKVVFLYLTEQTENNVPRNRVYKYDWNGVSLVNPRIILDLPALPDKYHNGGKLIVDSDRNLLVSIGDLNRNGMLQNYGNGSLPDDTSVILRIDSDGNAAKDNPLSSDDSEMNQILSRYYAYGIKNSFGMSFDPVTGYLWLTDNGPFNWDELNLARPGFNGGWEDIVGPTTRYRNFTSDLVEFDGSHYANPVFNWKETIGITDIEFLESDLLGSLYKNNIFVGDFNNGNLYYFEVNENRTGVKFDQKSHKLLDLIAHNREELSTITFGTGFGGITEIETGPDGYLYILSYINGKMYRIVPTS
jgi:glucose/arabinose dehydrogenase